MKAEKQIQPVFSLTFQAKYCLAMMAGSILSSLLLYSVLDKGLDKGYVQSLVTLNNLDKAIPSYLWITFAIQLGLIVLITVAIHLFVSHKIAGPVYRFELTLTSLLKNDLRQDIRTRQGDQLKPMVHSLNRFIASARDIGRAAEELLRVIDTELAGSDVDLDRIRESSRQLEQLLGQTQQIPEVAS